MSDENKDEKQRDIEPFDWEYHKAKLAAHIESTKNIDYSDSSVMFPIDGCTTTIQNIESLFTQNMSVDEFLQDALLSKNTSPCCDARIYLKKFEKYLDEGPKHVCKSIETMNADRIRFFNEKHGIKPENRMNEFDINDFTLERVYGMRDPKKRLKNTVEELSTIPEELPEIVNGMGDPREIIKNTVDDRPERVSGMGDPKEIITNATGNDTELFTNPTKVEFRIKKVKSNSERKRDRNAIIDIAMIKLIKHKEELQGKCLSVEEKIKIRNNIEHFYDTSKKI